MPFWMAFVCLLAPTANGMTNLTAAPSAGQATPGRLDILLSDWERHSKFETLDARFTLVKRSPGWDLVERFDGRYLLKSPKSALLNLDVANRNEKSRSFKRYIWDGERIFQYSADSQTVFAFQLREGETIFGPPQDRPPGFWNFFETFSERLRESLCFVDGKHLPFLFVMHPSEARCLYKMNLVRDSKEIAEIRFTPLTTSGRVNPEGYSGTLELDKKQFAPRAVLLVAPNKKDAMEYRFTDVRRNVPVKKANFQFKRLDGWKVIEARN
jgi:outer membrane lipoprotein-sorting protein